MMSPSTTPRTKRPSQTKIVATIGPASQDEAVLRRLIEAGVDVFRINTAHGSREEHQRHLDNVHRVSRELGIPVGTLADLPGPKIRLGSLQNDWLECHVDDLLTFVRGEESDSPDQLTATYKALIDELNVGDRVMLADGTVALRVESKGDTQAVCRVTQPGVIRSRQGINLPGVTLSIPTIGEVDRANAIWAASAGVDFLGLSFVRTAEDINQLKAIVAEHGPECQVIAKIEKPEAVADLEQIVAASDGIMVARGDLGVEIDIADMPVVQKRIIATCNRHRKPVIIATQMLDSMQSSRLPTRAEATDVANAILDGADACMLSGETAIGQNPIEAVAMMHRIAVATETLKRGPQSVVYPDVEVADLDPVREASARAAGQLVEELGAKLALVATETGGTALSLSKCRLTAPTVGASHSEATLRRMCLYWGVIPIFDAPVDDAEKLMSHVIDLAKQYGHVTSGNRVVMITGSPGTIDGHNTIVIHEVE